MKEKPDSLPTHNASTVLKVILGVCYIRYTKRSSATLGGFTFPGEVTSLTTGKTFSVTRAANE